MFNKLLKKKLTDIGFVFVAAFFIAACDNGSSSDEDTPTTDKYLSEIQGTYEELIPVLADEQYRDIWIARIQKYLDISDSDASAMVDMSLASMQGDLVGEEAVKAYDFEAGNYTFNCSFRYGVAKLTVSGDTIYGVDEKGKEVFRHTYSLVKSEENNILYKSDDKNSGDFTYFAFLGDTPKTTYHLEFQYGESSDKLGQSGWFEGDNAYWNAAAILVEHDKEMMTNVINLFVDENISAYTGNTENTEAE